MGWFLATLVLLGLGVLVAVGVLLALGVPGGTGIALRCDPSSPNHSRHPTSCRSVIRVGILVGVGFLVILGVLK